MSGSVPTTLMGVFTATTARAGSTRSIGAEYLLGEALELGRVVKGGFQRRTQRRQERVQVALAGCAVDAVSGAVVVQFRGVTRRASETEPVYFFPVAARVLHEPDRQTVRVKRVRFLRQIAEVCEVYGIAKGDSRAGLFEREEPGVGDEPRALRAGVELHAVARVPPLVEVDDPLRALPGRTGDRQRVPRRLDVVRQIPDINRPGFLQDAPDAVAGQAEKEQTQNSRNGPALRGSLPAGDHFFSFSFSAK
jgi:hypothetical protein